MSTNTLANLLNPSSSTDDSIIIPNGPTLSYAQYAEEIERVAGILAGAGVKPGRPVSIVLTKTDEVPAAAAFPEQFVADVIPQFWDLCSERLHKKKIFAASVTARVADRLTDNHEHTQVPLRIEPKGVLAPFQWILGHVTGK